MSERMRPYTRYRPVKTSDGEGGFTDALADPKVIYGTVNVFNNATGMIVRESTNVKIKDILVLDQKEVE